MREIKFRAWDKEMEAMRDWNTIICHDIGVFRHREWYELMQYTGLKDKNGVEIYEYSELDGAYEVIFKGLRYSLRHIPNNDIIDLHDYWRDKNGEIEVTREYTKV